MIRVDDVVEALELRPVIDPFQVALGEIPGIVPRLDHIKKSAARHANAANRHTAATIDRENLRRETQLGNPAPCACPIIPAIPLYMIFNTFSRYVAAWMIAPRDAAQLAE